MAIAGILTEPEAVVELEWRMPAGTVERQRVKVDRGRSSLSFAAQEWARLKLQGLEAEPELHRAEITRIGKEFALVTRGTSLIVLDRVEDYVRYEIAPPEALRAEYDRMRGQARQTAAREKSDHLERIVQRFQEKAAWWKRDFPKGDRPKPEQAMRKGARSEAAPRTAAMAPPAATMERGPEAGVAAGAAAGGVMPGILASAPAPMALRDQAVGEDARSAAKSAATGGAPGAAPATIRLQRWNPDAPYADRLRKAAKGDLYHVYLDERPSFTQSTAFFLDSADLFFERGEERLALRILSNLAEMDLENRHVLRILGYRLLQAKRPALAVPVLERVLELAPNEPQSWRDLGLACAENRQAQKAFDHLAQVVLRPWHDRFPDVELIALAELNALVSTTPEKVNTSGLDPRLLRNLPLDLRVGGLFRFSWRAGDGEMVTLRGEYREVVPGIRTVNTEAYEPVWYPGAAVVTTELADAEGGTALPGRLAYESREARDEVLHSGIEKGTAASWARLERLARKRAGLPGNGWLEQIGRGLLGALRRSA